jgi:hypothetical protein
LFIDRILDDLETMGGAMQGYVLVRVQDTLLSALEFSLRHDPLDTAVLGLESLLERVLAFGNQLKEMEVPSQEADRHQALVGAFCLYNMALSTLSESLLVDEHLYDADVLRQLMQADAILKAHQAAAEKEVEIDAWS